MYTPNSLLDAVVKSLISDKGDLLIAPWFSDAKAVSFDGGQFIISTRNELFKETLSTRFGEDVAKACKTITGSEITPVFITESEADEIYACSTEDIFSSFSFERFIVGNSNKFAHAAALAVAKNPASKYNPLFIYGQSGLGKTHLLYAIAGEIKKSRKDFKILYKKGDDFTNELVDSLQNKSMEEFREVYRQADLLLVDDIQFIGGKERTEEEFFHTFNALHESSKQVVLTSDRPPKDIARLADRLRTRFEAGLLADIQPPDLETRMALVAEKSELLGVKMPKDVISYIASCITNNVRELEGAVKKIVATHSLMDIPITLDMAEGLIQDIFKAKPGMNPTPDLILEEVSSYYNVSTDKIRSNSRMREIVIPRQVTAYLIRELTDKSLPDIGFFLNQHHTTIMHSISKLMEQMKTDSHLQNAVEDLINNIRNR